MNRHRLLLAISMLLLLFIELGFAEEAVQPGVSFVSPDGRYCVQLEVIDGSLRFVIKDNEMGRIDDSVVSTGVLYLHWAENSRSFATVEHISKGSYGRVVYLADDKWASVQAEPDFKGKMDYNVINLQLEADHVHYKFAVTRLAGDWTPIDHSFCELDVSLETGKVSNVKWAPISESELATRPHEPVCLPPMPRERYYHVCK